MRIYEFRVPLPVLTPKGKALAYFVDDYHIEHHYLWGCFIDDTGEFWSFPNPQIRIQNNQSIGRNVLKENHECSTNRLY
jgi:hypothetical protein